MKMLVPLFCMLLADTAAAEEITVVSKPSEIERLTGRLQTMLNRVSPGSTIRSCNPVVHEYAGSEDEIYGGFCSVGIQRESFRILMCDDRMVWKFSMTLAYNVFSSLPTYMVINFVSTSCPVGG
jgi:hypothetical protein